MPPETCFLSYLFVSFECDVWADNQGTNIQTKVFGPAIDILGMVIYGTELVLWLGVFACGGVFNLVPWLKAGSERAATSQEPISLHQMPSSTSVFRTASGSEVLERRGWPHAS